MLIAQLGPTLWDLRSCSPLGSSICGILWTRILEWVAFPFSKGSFIPRDWSQVACALGRFFIAWTNRKPWSLSGSVVSNSLPPHGSNLPGFSVHRILQARILEWVTISYSRGSSQTRDWTRVSCIAGRLFFLPSETQRKHVIVFIFVLTLVEGKYNVKHLDETELHSEFKDELHSRRPMYENT